MGENSHRDKNQIEDGETQDNALPGPVSLGGHRPDNDEKGAKYGED